jgi:hypothetical protein
MDARHHRTSRPAATAAALPRILDAIEAGRLRVGAIGPPVQEAFRAPTTS